MENKINNTLEIILKDRVKTLGEFLISICQDEIKKKAIKDTLIGIEYYKILMFITFLNVDTIEDKINYIIKIFKLNDTEDNREKIKNHINYFIDIKKIINS